MKVGGDHFFVQAVTAIDPVTSDFYVSCCYFELDKKKNAELDKYFKYIVSEGHIVSGTMLIILKLLFAAFFFTYDLLCFNLRT